MHLELPAACSPKNFSHAHRAATTTSSRPSRPSPRMRPARLAASMRTFAFHRFGTAWFTRPPSSTTSGAAAASIGGGPVDPRDHAAGRARWSIRPTSSPSWARTRPTEIKIRGARTCGSRQGIRHAHETAERSRAAVTGRSSTGCAGFTVLDPATAKRLRRQLRSTSRCRQLKDLSSTGCSSRRRRTSASMRAFPEVGPANVQGQSRSTGCRGQELARVSSLDRR